MGSAVASPRGPSRAGPGRGRRGRRRSRPRPTAALRREDTCGRRSAARPAVRGLQAGPSVSVLEQAQGCLLSLSPRHVWCVVRTVATTPLMDVLSPIISRPVLITFSKVWVMVTTAWAALSALMFNPRRILSTVCGIMTTKQHPSVSASIQSPIVIPRCAMLSNPDRHVAHGRLACLCYSRQHMTHWRVGAIGSAFHLPHASSPWQRSPGRSRPRG